MNFLNLLWSIIDGFFGMVFVFDLNNPFVIISCLVIVAFISIITFRIIFRKK